MSSAKEGISLEAIRQRLSGRGGDAYWNELEELAGTESFQELLQREFPSQAARFTDALPRRDFLRLMGGSLSALGLGACTRQPDETIVPFAATPESTIPGRPLFFATAMPLGGAAMGLLVESHDGRPTKVEGNPDHPASRGATDAFAQAATLSLYDPDRSHSVLRAGQISTWDAFLGELSGELDALDAVQGEGLFVLVSDPTSPTLAAQIAQIRKRFPQVGLHRWHPVHRDHEREGAELAYRADLATRYAFDRADVVVALDSDFLASGPAAVRYAQDFAKRRRVGAGERSMNRLYSVECSTTLTGAMADHRLAVSPSELENFARALASELGIAVDASREEQNSELDRYVKAIANDLRAHQGAGIVTAGSWQSPTVHALAHAMNETLGNTGNTVEHTLPVDPLRMSVADSMKALVDEIRAGKVRTLVMLGGNPVYDAPSDLEFQQALEHVPLRIHLSLYDDETSRLCHWHVPAAHFLESWGDTRAFDGTASIVQPLIAPLYGGHTEIELAAVLGGDAASSTYELVRAAWRASRGSGMTDDDFERFWRTSLHDGVIEGTPLPALDVSLRDDLDFGPAPARAGGLDVVFRPDASAYDGRFANNGWLQETPRPLTRLTWDNAALVSSATADELEVESGDVVELTAGNRTLEAPVWVEPGHPDGTVTLHLGYGRSASGRLGTTVGFDAYKLRASHSPWQASGVRARKVSGSHAFASVQDHGQMEGRDLIRVAAFDRFAKDPEHAFAPAHAPAHDPNSLSMYPDHAYDGHSWGMVIDLNACIGCNACMVACQSENNIPVVGKEEVARGREMHWIRIDRYYEEAESGLQMLHQPVPCMHCENAPCEVVCPVGATVHSSEGLNEMVYNRCVGTRYCSNNCPYKVRRFNFYHYSDYETESFKLGNNPDVSIRSRGVMEKCTYCVQRINQARITAKKDDRDIRDGELKTACQAVCPTRAITFGDINDETSAVSELRKQPHHYGLLEEVGTRPRTTYLGKLRNPNPELENV